MCEIDETMDEVAQKEALKDDAPDGSTAPETTPTVKEITPVPSLP